MKAEEFLDLLSRNELRELSGILGLDKYGLTRREHIDNILRSLQVRRVIMFKTGLKVKVRFRPTYGDGWKWCSRCRMSFRYFNGKSPKRCPLCGNLLRSRRRGRRREKRLSEQPA